MLEFVNSVMKQAEVFSVQDICSLWKDKYTKDDVSIALNRLRDKGLIIKHGSYYSVYK